jgi:hypothetical protein
MMRPAQRAGIALCLTAALFFASVASARTERLRWTQTGAVDSFRVYAGLASNSLTTTLNVGLPPKDSTGAYYYDMSSLADTATVYFAVSAWSGGLESVQSNVISRVGITSGGGGTTTPPPTGGGGASAAVVGFALWDALSDTVVDASFQSGDTISDNIRACAAIEIKGNAYLNADGPGSIKKVFDGVDKGCTGIYVENMYPFGWEDDASVGQFPCAASLTAIGGHTLTVTPYDGDNCSGTAGTPVTVNFTVSGPSSTPSTLGAPGQPFIVQ